METNEIMNNEIAEEIVNVGANNTLKKLGVAGAIVVVGGLTYKFVVKPTIKKIKEKRAAKEVNFEAEPVEENFCEE